LQDESLPFTEQENNQLLRHMATKGLYLATSGISEVNDRLWILMAEQEIVPGRKASELKNQFQKLFDNGLDKFAHVLSQREIYNFKKHASERVETEHQLPLKLVQKNSLKLQGQHENGGVVKAQETPTQCAQKSSPTLEGQHENSATGCIWETLSQASPTQLQQKNGQPPQQHENGVAANAQESPYSTCQPPTQKSSIDTTSYTNEEDQNILRFLSENEGYCRMMGNRMWIFLEKKADFCPGRSAESMKDRFYLLTLNGLANFSHILPQDQIDKFQKWGANRAAANK